MFRADPTGIVALIAVTMCGSLAVLLFRSGLRGSVARKLALLLIVEGSALLTSAESDAAAIEQELMRTRSSPVAVGA